VSNDRVPNEGRVSFGRGPNESAGVDQRKEPAEMIIKGGGRDVRRSASRAHGMETSVHIRAGGKEKERRSELLLLKIHRH
jgi:hypothetical protein